MQDGFDLEDIADSLSSIELMPSYMPLSMHLSLASGHNAPAVQNSGQHIDKLPNYHDSDSLPDLDFILLSHVLLLDQEDISEVISSSMDEQVTHSVLNEIDLD